MNKGEVMQKFMTPAFLKALHIMWVF